MSNWEYGEAYRRYPIEKGIAVFNDGSMLKTHDIFNPLPSFMSQADLVFVDPPWNSINISTFYDILTFLGNFCNSSKLSVLKQQHVYLQNKHGKGYP